MSTPSPKMETERSIPNTVDAQNPWLGLTSFTEETRVFFHGREEEGAELARRVERKLLTILFGQSGLGKTSILQAGLVPRLRPEGFCPVYVRLDYHPEAPSPADQIKRAVFQATEAAGTWTQSGSAVTGETLWEFLHHRDDVLKDANGRTLIPILIFDQFEEIFTLAQSDDAGRQRAREFLADLADLVENRPPESLEARIDRDEVDPSRFDFARADYRILISLREDYLANLEALKPSMPSVTQNRMRLARMTGAQATAAVRGPAPTLVTEAVAAAIVRFVAGGAELVHAEVEPSLLSLICRELNNTRIARRQPEISSDLLAGSRDTILQEFYERAVGDQPPGVRRFVEEELLTESGYRENIALERAKKSLAAAGANPSALDTLVNRRLLRVEERLDIRRIELMHDVLCTVVKASRTVRHEREAKLAIEQQLTETRAKEESTLRALRRARLIAAVCAVLMLAAAGSAVFGWINLRRARAAEAQAANTRALAEQARGQAEKLVGFLLEDFYEELVPTGRVEIVGKLADKAVTYYDGLPPELVSKETNLYRGLALARKASALNIGGKFAESKAVAAQAQKIFEDLRAAGDRGDDTTVGLALCTYATANVGISGTDKPSLLAAVELLRPIIASGRASRTAKLTLADLLQYLGHAEEDASVGILHCEEARGILAGMGAQDLSDLTAASIYGDVTDSQSRMSQRLGRIDEAEKLSHTVVDIAEKVLQQRPGDLRAMQNRYYAANMLGAVATDRYDFDTAEVNFAKSAEAAKNYTLFNPADATGWTLLIQSGRDLAVTYVEQGRVVEADRILHETAALEHDPRNKTGTDGGIFYAWRLIEVLAAQKGNLAVAEAALAEVHRVAPLVERDRNFDAALTQVANVIMDVFDYDLLAAKGDYATIHQRALANDEKLRKIAPPPGVDTNFRNDALRRNQGWLAESALRTGNNESAEAVARGTIEKPIAGRLGKIAVDDALARAKIRLGQALLGSGRRAEAMAALNEAVDFYRTKQTKGAGGTGFRQDLARALYELSRTQADDEGSRARRVAQLDEADALLHGMSVEAQQLQPSQELIGWIRDARAKAGL